MIAPTKSPLVQDHLSQIVAASSHVGRVRPSILSPVIVGRPMISSSAAAAAAAAASTINTARIARALEIEREASRKVLLARLSSAQTVQPSSWLVKSILAENQISQLHAARRKLALATGQQQHQRRVSSPSLLPTLSNAENAESSASTKEDAVSLQRSLLLGQLAYNSGSSSSISTLPQGTEAEEKVRINDVLCGRGGKSNHHPGNKRYRQVVSEMKKSYRTICTKSAKTDLSKAIVDHVIGYGGRFVKLDKASGKYTVLSLNEARKKTSQALREAKDVKWTT